MDMFIYCKKCSERKFPALCEATGGTAFKRDVKHGVLLNTAELIFSASEVPGNSIDTS